MPVFMLFSKCCLSALLQVLLNKHPKTRKTYTSNPLRELFVTTHATSNNTSKTQMPPLPPLSWTEVNLTKLVICGGLLVPINKRLYQDLSDAKPTIKFVTVEKDNRPRSAKVLIIWDHNKPPFDNFPQLELEPQTTFAIIAIAIIAIS